MKVIDRFSKYGIAFTIIFYAILAGIIIVTLNMERENFVETVLLLCGLFIAMIGFEQMFQGINIGIRKRSVMVWSLVAEGLLICLFISNIFLLIIIAFFMYLLNVDTLTKVTFNIMVSFTFFSSLFFYRFYLKLKVLEKTEKIVSKFKKEKDINPSILNKSKYKKEVINKIDFITIFATVFLLGNSTFTTLVPDSIILNKNPYNSIELRTLVLMIPIYVQSAYYKLFQD